MIAKTFTEANASKYETNYSETQDRHYSYEKKKICFRFVTLLGKKQLTRSCFYLFLEFALLLFILLNLFPSRPSSFPGSLGMNISLHIVASAPHYLLTSGARCHRSLPHAETVFS